MGKPYSSRVSRPIGASDKAFGGAGLNLGLDALMGETDMITVTDDFNGVLPGTEGFSEAAIWEDHGWVLTDVGVPVADEVSMNDVQSVTNWAPSCIRVYTGTDDDAGGNAQLDLINGGFVAPVAQLGFPHMWYPETAIGVTTLDNSDWVFACRIGLRADITANDGLWTAAAPGAKMFIGYSVAGEAAIMTAATGAISVAAAADQLLGFHVQEDGSIDGISQRVGNVAYVEGTNVTTILPAGSASGTLANGAITVGDTMWFDLALRLSITDHSEAANGTTTFYSRKLIPNSGTPGRDVSDRVGEGYAPWVKHGTVLTNQAPLHTVSMVPGYECINGPTAGTDAVFFIDSWTFGTSRFSHYSR